MGERVPLSPFESVALGDRERTRMTLHKDLNDVTLNVIFMVSKFGPSVIF